MSLKGKVAVVTGGGSGIGRAIALQLAKDGASVSVWDLNADSAEETASLITAEGGTAIGLAVDASSKTAIEAGAQQTREAFGPVTVLVNNAGVSSFIPLLELTEEVWDRTINVNLKGVFLCCQTMVPDMLAVGWGRIINITSSSVQTGAPNMAHYVSSKGGVLGLTRALAIELADKNITVNNVPPGFIDTPMLRASPIDVDKYAAAMPMKRAGKPEDIAAACSYLASEAANYITGQTIGANGGRYLT